MSEIDVSGAVLLPGLAEPQHHLLASGAELVTLPMRQLLGQGMFFIAPLLAGTREIGVLYADGRLSGRALKHEQFVAFKRFAELTGRCLDAISQRK